MRIIDKSENPHRKFNFSQAKETLFLTFSSKTTLAEFFMGESVEKLCEEQC